MNITLSKNTVPLSMPTTVISDGKIKKENLEILDLDQQCIDERLQSANIDSIADVFFAGVQNLQKR